MWFNQRSLTADEKAELERLNQAVKDAIAQRRAWLDTKMFETSKLKVGDEIYDLDTGQRLGVVRSLYRYWRDRNDGVLDTDHSCDYTYAHESSPMCTYNTSSQSGRRFGTKQEAIDAAQRALERLKGA